MSLTITPEQLGILRDCLALDKKAAREKLQKIQDTALHPIHHPMHPDHEFWEIHAVPVLQSIAYPVDP